MNDTELTIFYDGRCPLCATEMKQLRQLDDAAKLRLEDINRPDFKQRFPHINPVEADRVLHKALFAPFSPARAPFSPRARLSLSDRITRARPPIPPP